MAENTKKYMAKAKDKERSHSRLMALDIEFYKNFDTKSKIIKSARRKFCRFGYWIDAYFGDNKPKVYAKEAFGR